MLVKNSFKYKTYETTEFMLMQMGHTKIKLNPRCQYKSINQISAFYQQSVSILDFGFCSRNDLYTSKIESTIFHITKHTNFHGLKMYAQSEKHYTNGRKKVTAQCGHSQLQSNWLPWWLNLPPISTFVSTRCSVRYFMPGSRVLLLLTSLCLTMLLHNITNITIY